MRSEFLVFGAPAICNEDIEAVVKTLRSGWIGTGPVSAALERSFSSYKGTKYGVALSSCTAALHLAMIASGIQPGDEVITTPMTFCATANAILHCGAIPVFADVDRYTGLIDPTEIENKISKKTRALLPVHLHGRACAMDEIVEITRRHNITLIEDCAHAIETLYHGKHAGTFGQAGCFSFYVTKNVVGIEGGMVVSDDREFSDHVKILALHGLSSDAWDRFSDEGYKHYEVSDLGYKYNLPDVHAALALPQLERVEENLQRREHIWNRYNEAFTQLPCWIPPPQEKDARHARHLYTLLLDVDRLKITRDGFLNLLHEQNIGCGVHYRALHLHKYYRQRYEYKPEDFPNALWHSERTVSLPLSPALSDSDVSDVIGAVHNILKNNTLQ